VNWNQLKRYALKIATTIPGWHTRSKIVVFESDDWGSIRMPSVQVQQELSKKIPGILTNPFLRYDSLESGEDLNELFGVLENFRDINGNHPAITANFVTSNPDFTRIRESGFTRFYSELFINTYGKYPGCRDSMSSVQDGMERKVFLPQYHGETHLNVPRWMNGLKQPDSIARLGFDHQVFDLSTSPEIQGPGSFMDALRIVSNQELQDAKNSLIRGIEQFSDIFKFTPESFIAPRYIWSPEMEESLSHAGIKFLQGRAYQDIPLIKNAGRIRHKINYTGRRNEFGQIYLVRNVFFEPSSDYRKYSPDNVLKSIGNAFRNRKPAIVCTHRVNFIGGLDINNRKRNLEMLEEILFRLLKDYPDIIFLSTPALGHMVECEN
jgi:hypothetical protein